MKITLVSDTFPPDVNGVAMTLHRLTSGLLARGHEIHLCRPAPERHDDPPPAIKHPNFHELTLPSVPLPGYPHLRLGLPATRKLRSLWSKNRPDALYVATESPLGYSAVAAAGTLDIPVVSGFHTNFHTYTHDYKLPILERAATSYLRSLHNKTACTLVPSHDTANQLTEAGFERVKVLGRGVDTQLFSPSKRNPKLRALWGANDDTPVAIFVGRLASEKNLHLAARTFQFFQAVSPETRCVFVGDGPQRAALEKEHPHFIYTGMRSGEDLAQHYASADLFAFPSLSETFGNVLLEALASGLVTVSFDYACSQQLIEDGSNGFHAPFDDEDAFFAKAALALQHWNTISVAERARQTALKLSWDTIVKQFELNLKASQPHKQSPAAVVSMNKPKPKKKQVLRFKTIFLSDIHLGTPDSKVTQVIHFLRNTRCEKLVLNGDIIDAWSLRRSGKWTKSHTYFIRLILKKMQREDTQVVYIRGNHDDILTRFLPLKLDNLEMTMEHIHHSPHGKYLVTHGDGFDVVTTNHRWMAVLGAVGYSFLLRLNRAYNGYRRLCGKPQFSLSKAVKAKVKSAVSFIGNYEEQLQKFAAQRDCQGIICGHIHTPADKQIGDVHYLNSGDWVESLTAVVENLDRSFEVITYNDFCTRAHRNPKGGAITQSLVERDDDKSEKEEPAPAI
ncbi:MAG: glycosyltransferase [Verrucomicrobiota bacterium]